jgi:hypothetical protein
MPGNPFDNLIAKVEHIQQRLVLAENRIGQLETAVNYLIANQMKWAPGYRFPLPPLNVQ